MSFCAKCGSGPLELNAHEVCLYCERDALRAELAATATERDAIIAALERGSVLRVLEHFSQPGDPRRPQGGEQFPNLECCEIARDAVKKAYALVKGGGR